jgi:hypothetical protein
MPCGIVLQFVSERVVLIVFNAPWLERVEEWGEEEVAHDILHQLHSKLTHSFNCISLMSSIYHIYEATGHDD